MKITGRLLVFTLVLVVLATACKFFFGPDLDWSGFSPVIAIALFAGLIIRQKDLSFILPLVALFISDCCIQLLHNADLFPYAGFYGGQWKNYLLLLSATLLGGLLKGRSYGNLLAGGIIAPTVYFLVSNFMVWQASSEAIYAKTFNGLLTCYEAGLPFYRNSLVATLLFLPLILALYNFISRKKLALKLA